MIVNGINLRAMYDTGAEIGNCMSSDQACRLDLRLRTGKSDCKPVKLADGKIMRAIGRVKAWCSFPEVPRERMKCWFYAFKKLASPLVMSQDFLERTETLSKYQNRLGDYSWATTMPMLNLLGSTFQAKRRLSALVDGRQTYINADSGSRLDLMSPKYVKAHGYRIDRSWKNRKRVQLADSSVVEQLARSQQL